MHSDFTQPRLWCGTTLRHRAYAYARVRHVRAPGATGKSRPTPMTSPDGVVHKCPRGCVPSQTCVLLLALCEAARNVLPLAVSRDFSHIVHTPGVYVTSGSL